MLGLFEAIDHYIDYSSVSIIALDPGKKSKLCLWYFIKTKFMKATVMVKWTEN